MMNAVNTIDKACANGTYIVGLGKTGLSCARFLAKQGRGFCVVDSRTDPPGIEQLKQELPQVQFQLGDIEDSAFVNAEQLILSPGISVREPYVRNARNSGADIFGDIELFARNVKAPVVAITGSNGKSTVTTLLGQMVDAAGLKVKVGGNIGVPALDLLEGELADFYILELSSFQLETTYSLNAIAAVVLNVCEDHMDRYDGLEDYAQAKQAVYRGNGAIVVNADDAVVMAMQKQLLRKNAERKVITFSLQQPLNQGYGIIRHEGLYLAKGTEKLLSVADMRMQGEHNWANALAALALGEVMALPRDVMLEVLRQFPGLPHRTQWVREVKGVNYINDSKGTNVGATVSAIQGLSGRKILIAGGMGKGADFTPLRDVVLHHDVLAVVLLGRDADLMAQVLSPHVPVHRATDMKDAVNKAEQLALCGDLVLLSPACASFDMFDGFEHRGDCFVAAVEALPA